MKTKTSLLMIIALLLYIGCEDKNNTESNVISHWTFDEMNGNVLKDQSGNGHNGIIYYANWGNGFKGGALSFDSDSYVTVPYSDMLQPLEEITIEARLKFDAALNVIDEQAIITTNENGGYGLWVYNSHPNIFIQIDSTYYSAKDTSSFVIDRWYHIAGTYDGNTIKFYVNGVLKNSIEANGLITYRFQNALQIGADADIDEEPEPPHLIGTIDEIRISNIALTPDKFLDIP